MSHKHSVTDDTVKVIGIATIAGTIGACLALLWSPRSGKQLRQSIKNKANQVTHPESDDGLQNELTNPVQDAKAVVKSATKEVTAKMRAATHDVQSKANTTSDKIKKDIDSRE